MASNANIAFIVYFLFFVFFIILRLHHYRGYLVYSRSAEAKCIRGLQCGMMRSLLALLAALRVVPGELCASAGLVPTSTFAPVKLSPGIVVDGFTEPGKSSLHMLHAAGTPK